MVKIIDTREDFQRFLEHRKDMDPIDAYKKYYFEPNQDILLGLAMTHTRRGLEGIEETIQNLNFDLYEEQFQKVNAAGIVDETERILSNIAGKLPGSDIFPYEFYLVFGFNTMNGCSTFAKDKPVSAIGLEYMGGCKSVAEYKDLVIHELVHLVRSGQRAVLEDLVKEPLDGKVFDLTLAEKVIANITVKSALVDEGLASIAPAILEDEEITDDRLCQLLFYSENDYQEIKSRKEELWEELNHELDSSDQELLYKWTVGGPHVKQYGIPERSLYYLGAELMLKIYRETNLSFKELVTMKAGDILQLNDLR